MADDSARPAWLYELDDDDAGIPRVLAEGLETRIFAGDESMLSVVSVDPHSEGSIHSHDEEQWGVLLEGSCVRIQDGEEVAVSEGDFWHTPAGVEHGIRTGDERATVLDVFAPPRPEYREAGEGFAEE